MCGKAFETQSNSARFCMECRASRARAREKVRKKAERKEDRDHPVDPLCVSVCEYYSMGYGKKTIGKSLGISESKVRKILVSQGMIQNEATRAAAEAIKQYGNVKAAAEALGKSPTWVAKNMAYEKEMYDSVYKSRNAKRIIRSRTKAPKKEKVCAVCGKPFTPQYKEITCSPECKRIRSNAQTREYYHRRKLKKEEEE